MQPLNTTMRNTAQRAPRVLFAEDFDEEITVVKARPSEPPAPGFTAADLEEARRIAHAEGLAEGRNEAAQHAAVQVRQASARFMAELNRMGEALAEAGDAQAAALASTMLAALAACLPELCRRHGEREMSALVAAILPGLAQEPEVEIAAHPSVLPALNEQVAALRGNRTPRIATTADDRLAPGDVVLNWRDGQASRSAAQICAGIEQAFAAQNLLPAGMLARIATFVSENCHGI